MSNYALHLHYHYQQAILNGYHAFAAVLRDMLADEVGKAIQRHEPY
jgi:uncharacterized membrane protein